jgi:hypothetical protein
VVKKSTNKCKNKFFHKIDVGGAFIIILGGGTILEIIKTITLVKILAKFFLSIKNGS